MSVWIWSAFTGLNAGVLVFLLVLVPVLLWQFRRFGTLSAGRLFGAAAVSVYLSALVSYTQLPLPEDFSTRWCSAHAVTDMQLVPFESFRMISIRASEIGWADTLTSTLGLQVIFNVALFIPWGIIMRGFFERSFLFATFSGVLMSVFVEVTQATGVWGYFPCAYRLGDIDDLLTNSLGAFLGALIAPLVLFWMPQSNRLKHARLNARPVTRSRKILGMFFNVGFIWIGSVVVTAILRTGSKLLLGKIDVQLFEWVAFAVHTLMIILVLIVPAMQGKGSLGQQAVWLHPRWKQATGTYTRGSLPIRLLRSAIFAVPLAATALPHQEFATALFGVLVCVTTAMVVMTNSQRSLSERLTGAELKDTRVRARS